LGFKIERTIASALAPPTVFVSGNAASDASISTLCFLISFFKNLNSAFDASVDPSADLSSASFLAWDLFEKENSEA